VCHKRVVDWGKQGSFRDLLRHMSSPSQPIAVRHLALYSCLGSKDGAMCVRALESPSSTLRGLAAHILIRITDDNTMPQVGRLVISNARHAPLVIARGLGAVVRLARSCGVALSYCAAAFHCLYTHTHVHGTQACQG
jgi:hypothetical protein